MKIVCMYVGMRRDGVGAFLVQHRLNLPLSEQSATFSLQNDTEGILFEDVVIVLALNGNIHKNKKDDHWSSILQTCSCGRHWIRTALAVEPIPYKKKRRP